jgi:hypothetical protein
MTRLLLAPLLALAVAAPLAGAASAAVYCVERDADTVLGHRLHDGVSRCVPVP